jgi:hypothetical protein
MNQSRTKTWLWLDAKSAFDKGYGERMVSTNETSYLREGMKITSYANGEIKIKVTRTTEYDEANKAEIECLKEYGWVNGSDILAYLHAMQMLERHGAKDPANTYQQRFTRLQNKINDLNLPQFSSH